MDGVLLITTQSSDQSWHQVCQQFAPRLKLSTQNLEEALIESRYEYMQDINHDPQKQQRDRLEPFETRCETVDRALRKVGRRDPTIATKMVSCYEAIRDEHRQLAPYAREVLQKLQERPLPLVLISNGNATYQRNKINQHNLASYFTALFIEEEFGVAKPDQRIFLAALDLLHIAAREAWMVGDNLTTDIAASQQIGIMAVWCDLAKRGLPEGCMVYPDRTIHTLPELFDFF